HRAYHAAVARVADPTATLAYTPKRVLRALRDAGPGQTCEAIRSRISGRRPTLGTVHDALWQLEEAGLAARQEVGNGQPPRGITPSTASSCAAPTTCGIPSRPGWRTPASRRA